MDTGSDPKGIAIGIDTRDAIEVAVDVGIIEFTGTEADLRAEGLIPADVILPENGPLPIVRWEAGVQRFMLRRLRTGQCHLLIELASDHELEWALRRVQRSRRLAAEARTLEGLRRMVALRTRAAAAARDPAWASFKARIASLATSIKSNARGGQ